MRSILLCLSETASAIYLFIFCFGFLPAGSAVLPCLSVRPLLLLLLVIWPTSGQFFDVPVQLLGDAMMPVNNSTVPLCWTCVMPTVLAQQAAYFRGSTRLLLLPSSGIHWKLPDLLFWFLLLLRNCSPYSVYSVQSVAWASVICRFQVQMEWVFVSSCTSLHKSFQFISPTLL